MAGWDQKPVEEVGFLLTPLIGGEITPVTHLFSAIYRGYNSIYK